MPEKKTAEQIAQNVAKRADDITTKNAMTQEIDSQREELIAFLDELPLKLRVQTLTFSLGQIAASEFPDKQEAKEVMSIFNSRAFKMHMAQVMKDKGIEGALDEMANLDLDNPADILHLFTGQDYTDEEIQELFADEL